ncbi:MAG: hypothetical protein HY255_09985 [Betaproteobacteria bacterium]|nr:hypothetical protein [Betaproteobacteria bacterium]
MVERHSSIACHLLLATFLSLAPPANAGCKDDTSPEARICSAESPWRDYSKATLHYAYDDAPTLFDGAIMSGEKGDFRIDLRIDSEKFKKTIDFMMIGGAGLMVRGDDVDPIRTFSYMDLMAVPVQLPITILDLVFPMGPQQLQSRANIDLKEVRRQIDTATINTGISYGPPWHATGIAKRTGPNSVEFEIALSYQPVRFDKPVEGPSRTIKTRGTLTYDTKLAFPDSQSVEGWTFPGAKQAAGESDGKALDGQGSRPRIPKVSTVGDVRKLIEETLVELEKKKALSKSGPDASRAE